ncbi:hypothetical protein LR48_Vigan773s000100 [Vigna angularis]|uniref:histidinol-phosphate transaminase n=1 Tax=Phaseolus angularis TaxID=3914 RepID=A0A0L9TH05_PHAAN|nr:hypothetical protein LR48_Vigan773s000100 [Vigna angularis]
MGVIDFYNSTALCWVKSNTNLKQQVGLPLKPICSFVGNQRKFVAMASTIPVEQVNNGPLQVTGDSFIREHLRKLSPYQPILPFEILMGVIDFYNSTALCWVKSNTNLKQQVGLPLKPICSFVGNQRKFVAMASTIPVEQVNNGPLQVTGDSFIREHLRKLSPYQPILPFEVLSARLGRKPEDIVKLDANENPYGPPPEVMEALGSIKFPYVYPDPESRRLRAALAEDSGLEAEYILAGCGADELIDLIMRCVLDPGDKIVDCPPTFTMYEFDAAVNGALVIKALGSIKFPYVYPDPESRRLRAALAEDSGLEAEYILAGCGADELIDLIMRCVLDPGDKIVDCPPTFTMYEFDAAVNGALVIKGESQESFRDGLKEALVIRFGTIDLLVAMRIARDGEEFQGGEKVGNGSEIEEESYWGPTSGEVTLFECNRYNPSRSGVAERFEANHPGRSGVAERSEANHPGKSEAAESVGSILNTQNLPDPKRRGWPYPSRRGLPDSHGRGLLDPNGREP